MHIPIRDKKYIINPTDNPVGTQILLINHIVDGHKLTCGKRYDILDWTNSGLTVIISDDNHCIASLSRHRFIKIPKE